MLQLLVKTQAAVAALHGMPQGLRMRLCRQRLRCVTHANSELRGGRKAGYSGQRTVVTELSEAIAGVWTWALAQGRGRGAGLALERSAGIL